MDQNEVLVALKVGETVGHALGMLAQFGTVEPFATILKSDGMLERLGFMNDETISMTSMALGSVQSLARDGRINAAMIVFSDPEGEQLYVLIDSRGGEPIFIVSPIIFASRPDPVGSDNEDDWGSVSLGEQTIGLPDRRIFE